MTKTNPPQMFDHILEPIKGWFGMNSLDKDVTPLLLTDARLISGRVGYLNAAGLFVPGLAANAMPLFMFPNASDFDVYRDAGGVGGGKMMALVATGGYELQSSEFIAGVYAPNDPLTARNVDDTNMGKLLKGVFYTNTICGVVSDGQLTNENSIAVLQFWSYFLPV